jgi:hypothetical protein
MTKPFQFATQTIIMSLLMINVHIFNFQVIYKLYWQFHFEERDPNQLLLY